MKLSKRETVLLIVLLVIALVFVEYKLLYVPGKARLDSLQTENEKVQAQVDEINRLIASIPSLTSRKNGTLQELDQITKPFYGSLKTDALLWNARDLIEKSGLALVSIGTTEPKSTAIQIQKSKTVELTYQLKKLSEDYANVSANYDKPSPTPTPAPSGTGAPNNSKPQTNEVEAFSVVIKLSGTYDQLKQFISSVEALNKSINLSTLSIKSTPTSGVIEAMLNLDYYGIQKINKTEDISNTWQQPPIGSGSGDPFYQIVVSPTVTPKPTTAPTR